MSIVQIGILGIVATILAMQFQNSHKEYVVVIGLAVAVLVFFSILTKLEVVIDAVNEIQQAMSIEVEYIESIVKMLGITYIAELSSNICKDVGYASIAKQIELFAKVTILALSMPILLALLQTIEMFLA